MNLFTVPTLLNAMLPSVHIRFEQIISYISVPSLMDAIKNVVSVSDPKQQYSFLLKLISDSTPCVPIQPEFAINTQYKFLNPNTEGFVFDEEPLPVILPKSSDYWNQEGVQESRRIKIGEIARRIESTNVDGFGLVMIVAMHSYQVELCPDMHLFVGFNSYLREPGDSFNPCEINVEKASKLPEDFSGPIRIEDLISEFSILSDLPHILVFLGHTRVAWESYEGTRRIGARAIVVTFLTDLDEVQMREQVLEWSTLGKRAQFLVSKNPNIIGDYAAFLVPPDSNLPYGLKRFAIQRIRSDVGLSLFAKICQKLGIEAYTGARPHPQIDLFGMLAFSLRH